MTNKEAALALTELLAAYRDLNKWDIKQKYYEAVTLACGYLLVDEVLSREVPKRGEELSEEN